MFANGFCAIFDLYSYLVFVFLQLLLQAPSVHIIDNMQHTHLGGKLTSLYKAGCVLWGMYQLVASKEEVIGGFQLLVELRYFSHGHGSKYIWSPSVI